MSAPRPERRSVTSRAVRPVARAASALLEPLFYWSGLLDPEGRPSNAKIVYTVAAFAVLAMTARIGLRMVEKAMPVTWEYVGLVALVLAFSTGTLGFFKFLRLRYPNGGDKPVAPVAPASSQEGT